MNTELCLDPLRPSGVGYKSPPSSKRWKKGTSGNSKGRPKSIDIKALVQKANAKKVLITIASGKKENIPRGDVMIQKMAHEAIKGDIRACKLMMNLAMRYCKPSVEPETDYDLHVVELDEAYLKYLKGFGCISPDCSTLNNLSKAEVQKAFNEFKKIWDDPDERERRLRRMWNAN
ncbi:MAG TPA: DUF5681 domain-containing protein [Rhizomicrobium sp.]